MLGLSSLLKLTRSLYSSSGNTATRAGSPFRSHIQAMQPAQVTMSQYQNCRLTEGLTHRGKIVSCQLHSMGIVGAGKSKAGVAQSAHTSAITDQPQSLSKPSQKLVAITRSFPSSSLCWWVKSCILAGLSRACMDSLARLPVLHRGQRAGWRWPSWGLVEPGRSTSNHETGTAIETGPYEWDGVQGSAEKLFRRGSFTAPQMLYLVYKSNQAPRYHFPGWQSILLLFIDKLLAAFIFPYVCCTSVCFNFRSPGTSKEICLFL